MLKKILTCLLVASSPFITPLGAISGQYHELKGVQDFESSFEVMPLTHRRNHHHHHHKDDCCDGRDGRDGRDGKDGCCCSHSESGCLDVAYFYLLPNDVVEENRVIQDRDPITWDADVFTIKSDGININEDDNSKIVFDHSGIYSITYTVFARPFESEADWYTMELRLNNSSLTGSRFTQSAEDDDAVEVVGQIITYIPANGRLQLFNVSGQSGNSVAIRLDNEGGRQGVVASISIQKIADIVN